MSAPMWLLTEYVTDGEGGEVEVDWSYGTFVAPGPTAQDAMRALVAHIKERNAKYAELARRGGYATTDDDIPSRCYAAPMRGQVGVSYVGSDRKYQGEAFRTLWDFEAAEEVRL